MTRRFEDPLERLRDRLRIMGQVLGLLCCAWIAVVGTSLLTEVNSDTFGNHRSPAMQERLKDCDGTFAQRFACTDELLLKGERGGASQVFLRIMATLMLPAAAWIMWRAVLDRTDKLCRR